MHRWKSAAGLLALSVVTLAIVDACAPGVERRVGEMLVDAGTTLAGSGAGGNAGSESTSGAGGGEPHGAAGTGSRAGSGVLSDAGQILIDAGMALMDAGTDAGSDAAAQEPTSVSGSRIQLRKTTQIGSDGTQYEVPGTSFYDTMLDTSCSLLPMSDGTRRCVPPSDGSPSSYFSDANCSVRLASVTGGCASARFFWEFAWFPNDSTSCAATYYYRVYRAGTEYGGTVYRRSGENCETYQPPAGTRLFSIAAEIAPSELIEFTDAVEPL